jgi:formylglycine-generating enzyme required for sulfatase activity
MLDPAAALRSFEDYRRLSPDAKRELACAVAGALGAAFEPLDKLIGRHRLAAVRHQETRIVFVAVPGGSFDMGLTEADLEAAAEHVDWTAGVRRFVEQLERRCRPVHRVTVRPFLCAVDCLSRPQIDVLGKGRFHSDTFPVAAAKTFMAEIGFRLPSEAELEYLAREGGHRSFVNDVARALEKSGDWTASPTRNALGIHNLNDGAWAADDWHEGYDGAPSTSEPWLGGDPRGVYRGGLPDGPQDRDELLFALAAFRGEGAGAGEGEEAAERRYFLARPALDLP